MIEIRIENNLKKRKKKKKKRTGIDYPARISS